MTWIKICGTTNLADARLAIEAGADALGFIFAPSPRQIEPNFAREIIRELPQEISKVGVFVGESLERVRQIADQAGVTAIQLHGGESSEYATELKAMIGGREIIRTFSATLDLQSALSEVKTLPSGSAIMLDSGSAVPRGGTGQTFDWSAVRGLVGKADHLRWIVAGGLTPGNVRTAIETLQPWGVDVVSGVEAEPGRKDPAKVKAFVAAVRAADERH